MAVSSAGPRVVAGRLPAHIASVVGRDGEREEVLVARRREMK
ncbi:MAG: hypothetical protein ACRDR6_24100 [Pseudonocardiaceae bacterium]